MKRVRYLVLMAFLLLGSVTATRAQGTRPDTDGKPFILPVAGAPSPSTWIFGQPYGNTTGAYLSGAANYSAGQYLHFGVDISMPCGTPLVAVADGVVASVDNLYRGSAPHNLLLRFPDLGVSVLYGHLLERPALVEGQPVQQGDFVALSGDPEETCEGRPHLHFEVRSLDETRTYNPIHFIDAPWHSLTGLDSRTRPVFQRDLTNSRRWMSLEDQPDVQFGGRRLNDYAQTWPPPFNRSLQASTLPDHPYAPIAQNWTLRQVGEGGCCAGAWWTPDDNSRVYVIDGVEGQPASVFAIPLDGQPPTVVRPAPPPFTSADGTYELIYEPDRTVVRRLADGAEWHLAVPDVYPILSPDNHLLAWPSGDAVRDIVVASVDGSFSQVVWTSQGRGASARWLDSAHLLISEREPSPGQYATLSVVNVFDQTSYTLGTWHNIRNLQIAPGGARIMFISAFNPDAAADGLFALDIAPDAVAQRLPWFADYRWRDAESVLYITFDPATDIQQLNYYHLPTAESVALTDPGVTPFTIANGDWSVSPDGNAIIFQEAADGNLRLLAAGE